jgi:adenosine deaminase
MRDLRSLPKAHLHLHLEGAMRPSTLRDLAAEDGVAVPPVMEFQDFTSFVALYRAAVARVDREKRLRRLVREAVEDAAADGVVWLEPSFYSPPYRGLFGTDQAAIEVVLDELRAAGAELGVGTALVVAADRTVDPSEALELARVAARLASEGVSGFGLANDEAGHPPGPFGPAFAVAREAGLMSVPHGGELDGPESVLGCLEECGAHRVMHGVRAVESAAVMQRLADSGVCLDVCPSSNLALGVVRSIEEHPLPRLLEAGIRCSINADDPLLFGPGVLDEYQLCRDRLGLDDRALARVAAFSLEASSAPRQVVRSGLDRINEWAADPRSPG